MLVDIRTVPDQSHPQIQEKLKLLASNIEKQVCNGYAQYDRKLSLERDYDLKVRVEIITDRPCTLTARNEPIVKAADWATRKHTGKEPLYAGVPGATDGTYLWALKNIPIVTMGAGDRQVPHQVDEWVDLDQLLETARIYAMTALHYLYPGNVP